MFKNRSSLWIAFRSYMSASRPELPHCEYIPKQYKGPAYEQLIKVRKARVSPALFTYYRTPLAICEGHMQWVFDIDGNRYLDMFGGIATVSVGHCHPFVTEAAKEQLETLTHISNVYMHPKIQEYAERLTDKLPGDLKVAYFVNSGSEANDLAVLMARSYTGNHNVLALTNCYHGMTIQTMNITSLPAFRYPQPNLPGIYHAPHPDVCNGEWGGQHCRDSPVQTTRSCNCGSECTAANKYFEQLHQVVKFMPPKQLAAFIVESIQGIGGTVQFPKGYIKKVYKLIKENGGLFIADEVQTGFGRTGEHFWGFETHGIQPDIVTMAKGIGNGFPLAAVVTTPEISKGLMKAMHFNTFGGNPVACAVGKAVLDVIENENCQQNSLFVGTYMLKQLSKLRDEYAVIGDVRGKGLMIGVELVTGKGGKPIPSEDFGEVMSFCRDNKLILGKGGVHGNVLRIKPPMCVTKEDADYTVAVLKLAVESISAKYV